MDDSGVVVESSLTEPRIDRVGGRHVLRLPVAMDSALRVLLPTFRATPRDAFDPSVAAWVWKRHPETALFAVVADFDGDRRADVAIQSTAGIVIIMNAASGPRAECPQRCSESDAPAVGSVYTYIELQPRGVVPLFSEDEQDVSITLLHDGFQEVYFEKASEVFYYEKGTWKCATTSD